MWSSTAAGIESRAQATRWRGRLIACAIFAVAAAPFIAGQLAYRVFPPTSKANYGDLVTPKRLPATRLMRADGRPFALEELQGKWVLLQTDNADCGAGCQAKLFNMRQARLAQGINRDRVERVWLLLDGGHPPPDLAPLYDGAIIALGGVALANALPADQVRDHVFLLDPLGLVMLRFPKDAEPKRMMKDLSRLLKYSSIG